MAESAIFVWEGTDKQGRKSKGEITSTTPAIAKAELRRQGIVATRVKKKGASLKLGIGGKVKPADVALFTRQMATMMRAGVPLVQAFDIVSDGVDKPKLAELIRNVTDSGADTLLGGDLGCLLNIAGRLKRVDSDIKVYHAAEVLADMTDVSGLGDPDPPR